MKKIFARYLAVVLSVILVFTVSCASVEKDGSEMSKQEAVKEEGVKGQADETKVMGRFREEKIVLPMSVRTLFNIESEEDGSVSVLFESEPGSFHFYGSSDGGVSWEAHDIGMEWLPQNYRIVSACFGADGRIALSAGKMSEDAMDDKQAVGEYAYFLIEDASGSPQVQELPLQLPEPKEENLQSGYGLTQIRMSDEGIVYGMFSASEGEDIDFQVLCFNSVQGEALWQLKTSAAEINLYEDKIYLNVHSLGK